MENNFTKNIITTVGVLIILSIVFISYSYKPNMLGQVAIDESYNSTTTQSTWNNTTGCWRLIKPGFGTLHTINLSLSTSNAKITLYDATTTVNGNIYGTTTLAEIPLGASAGSYIYKTAFARGLVADFSNGGTCPSIASTTITYK